MPRISGEGWGKLIYMNMYLADSPERFSRGSLRAMQMAENLLPRGAKLVEKIG